MYFSKEKLKRIGRVADRLSIRPHDAGARLESLFALPRERVPATLGALILETFDLVDAHRPDVDTARARRLFAMELEPCTERPGFPRPA